ncbi:putative DNA polymerase zeta catalytic subunit [Halteromyces radiatus]|uniref:putative DNA polymerase zeta catalytic subunit n=1 Tax=Halteromyces radiatus TaxID=101107 RepID=UPI00221E6F43|nr:putative DNA polymerase zeta catalytic subunit [Halteromyces radiatus]KAI8089385.1 putative DNA polymerase zeta catalytic subunit [Halteromyces radiatus]
MQPFISVRIVNIDHYLTEPGPYDSHYCPFSDWPLKKIPVLRIFGSTPGGQKTCVHIHQIYPYLYVPYPLDNVDQQQLQQNIYQFGVSLNKAIRLSYDRHGSNDQHIAAIVLVKGIPFYGYHVQYSTFLKIYYTNPAEKQRITEILQNGIVMNTFYQPYEAHLSFELQFLMDYNLFGMNWIRLLTYDDNRETNDDNNPDIEKDVLKLGTKFRWDDVDRTSYCELEIDTTGMMIINRLDITERNIHADLDEEIKYQEKTKNDDSLDEKLVKSLALIWKDERRRRQERGISPIFSSLPQQTSDERDSVHREWSTESKLRNIINTMVDHQGGSNYNKPEQDHPDIMTAFQAVEALYSQGYSQFIATKQQQQQERPPPPSTEHTDAMPSTIPISSSSQQKHFINHDVFTAEAYPHTATTTTTPIYRHVSTTTMTRSVPEHRTTSVADGIEGETSTASQISSSSSSSISSSSDGHHQPNYFTKKITGMWSPRSGDEIRDRQQSTSFWTDPPQPISPTGRHVDVKNDNNTIEFSGASKQDDNNNLIELNKLNSNDDIIVECESRDKNNIKSSETYDEKAYDNKYGKSSDHDNNKNNCGSNGERYFTFALRPPIIDPKESKMTYQEPYYSNIADVPPVPKVFSAKEFKLISKSIDHLKPFDAHSYGGRPSFNNLRQQSTSVKLWTPATPPPTYEQVLAWAKNRRIEKTVKTYHTQIDCATGNDTYNFKYSGSKPKSKVTRIRDYLDLFSLEIHVNTKEKMMPDPSQNEVQVIFWCLKTEDENISKNSGYDDSYHVGIISLDNFDITKIGISGIDITLVAQEQDLLWALVDKVRHYDPDILVGYELHNSSWGYLIERALVYNINLMDELARVYCESQRIFQDPWGYRKASVFRITGRHMLNVWRLMRSEINLTSYRFENLAYNVLHRRVPHYSYATLTSWYKKGPAVLKNRLFHYYLDRVQMNLDLLDISEIINKISESARVFGIDFYSVITRGSQFKVESIMLRIAKPENFLMISPSRKQVAGQRAIECLPLVMEPISQYYSSPLLVLDFQSLYPSIMIAYNYCYSTCVGKIGIPGESSNKLGVGELNLPDGLLGTVMDHLNVSPNGVAFVKPSIRKSLLAKMLTELLETRVMVKTAMKDYKDDSGLSRLLNARQLTLKYVANVTYGYTSASFSGRMPCVEVADSIVQTGRETLERAIKLINENPTWGAKVVYGDTDSVFVSLPGKTRSEAFDIGRDIATTVTKMNPSPVKLKFEKVYHPSLLLAKKRYVGNKFEHQDEVDPVFETKGLEIVRRDGTAATQKIMEYCIKILFQTQDMSKVKEYLYEQWTKILSNRVSIQDFIIAKEVRLGTYRNLPHGAQVAHAQMSKDPRSEPQYGERVPYVVVNQGPNARLKDRVTKPETLLHDKSLRLDADYYIRKQIIAPLERVFNLVGVDVKAWYDEMPRSRKAMALSMAQPREWNEKSNNRIDQYYASSHCIVCSRLAHQVICPDCLDQPSRTVFTLISRQRQTQKRLETALLICQNCSGLINADLISTNDSNELKIGNTGYMDMPCDSLDCPVLYERIKACHDVYGSSSYDSLIEDLRQRG